MKKTLLLLFAFMASLTGAWAQDAPTTVPDAPTILAAKVKTVFSATYGNAVGLAGDANTRATVAGTSVIHSTGKGQYAFPLAPFSVGNMAYLHFDIWANEATTAAFSMYCTSAGWIGKQENLIAGWNSITIPLSYFTETHSKNLSGNITELNLCKSLSTAIDGFNNFDVAQDFYIANIYYYTDNVLLSATATDIAQTTLNLNLTAFKGSSATTDEITYTITWNNGESTITPNPTGTSGVAKVVAVEGLTPNTSYTFHIVAQDNNGGSAEVDVNANTLLPAGIAPTTVPVPTYDAGDVITIYGYYGVGYNALNGANQSQFDVDGGTKKVWKLENYTNADIHFADNYDAPTYDYLVVDIYSEHAVTICFYPQIWANDGGGTNKGTQFNLVANAWTHCVVDIHDLMARTNKASSEGVRFYDIQFTGRLANKVDNVNEDDGFANAAGSNNIYIGNVYFAKGAATVSITPTYNKTTYVTTTALNFTAVDGLDAYVATSANASSVTMTKVEDPVPAGTPLLLIGTAGTTYNVPVVTTASAPAENLLCAGDGTTVIGGTSRYDYILYTDGLFYRANEGALAAGKAYLHLDAAPAGARSLNIVFDDEEVTSISEELRVKSEKSVPAAGVFDLQGRKVAQPQKGLYIVNGKKVVIK